MLLLEVKFMQDPNWTLEDGKLMISLNRACTRCLLSGLSSEVRQALLRANVLIGWHYRYHRYVVVYTTTLKEADYLAKHQDAIVERLQSLLGAFRFAIAEGYPGKSRGVLVKYIQGVDV